jgi:hypothetical protein
MARTAKPWARRGSSSTFTLASTKAPECSAASRSRSGPRLRQGPHQGAQKSTTTGRSAERWSTSRSKSASRTSKTFVTFVAVAGFMGVTFGHRGAEDKGGGSLARARGFGWAAALASLAACSRLDDASYDRESRRTRCIEAQAGNADLGAEVERGSARCARTPRLCARIRRP